MFKGAIVISDPKEDPFLSSLFLVKKKDGGNYPVVNLKDLNRNVPYQQFKMKGLFLLKKMLLSGDKMCKIDLKDAYFVIRLSVCMSVCQYVRIQEVCQFPVERSPIQVLLSLLWTFSSSSGFYEAIKIPHLSLEKGQCKNNNLP